MSEHHNQKRGHFCPSCYHSLFPHETNTETGAGMCLYEPPKAFVIGMVPASAVVNPKDPGQNLVPILRAYYPPVGPKETCSKWEPATQGEA